jgi:hypothetical protein
MVTLLGMSRICLCIRAAVRRAVTLGRFRKRPLAQQSRLGAIAMSPLQSSELRRIHLESVRALAGGLPAAGTRLQGLAISPCLLLEDVAHPLFDETWRVLRMSLLHQVPGVSISRKLLRSERTSAIRFLGKHRRHHRSTKMIPRNDVSPAVHPHEERPEQPTRSRPAGSGP